jgi:hypothetical protein
MPFAIFVVERNGVCGDGQPRFAKSIVRGRYCRLVKPISSTESARSALNLSV